MQCGCRGARIQRRAADRQGFGDDAAIRRSHNRRRRPQLRRHAGALPRMAGSPGPASDRDRAAQEPGRWRRHHKRLPARSGHRSRCRCRDGRRRPDGPQRSHVDHRPRHQREGGLQQRQSPVHRGGLAQHTARQVPGKRVPVDADQDRLRILARRGLPIGIHSDLAHGASGP